VAPDAALAVDLAERVVKQHIGRARGVRAGIGAHHRVKSEHRLHQIVFEPVVEMLAGGFREQVVDGAQVLVRQPPQLAAEQAGLHQFA
jgi:hypothetical protein